MYDINEWVYWAQYYYYQFELEFFKTLQQWTGNEELMLKFNRLGFEQSWVALQIWWIQNVANAIKTDEGRTITGCIWQVTRIYQYFWGFRSMIGWIPYINPYNGVMAFFSSALDWVIRPVTMVQPSIPFIDVTYFQIGMILNILEAIAFFFYQVSHEPPIFLR